MSTTIFKVYKTTTLKEIKDWFAESFPLLKIEFYSESHHAGEGTPNGALLDEMLTLKEIGWEEQEPQELIIFDDYSTNLVEHIFRTKLKLNVQIFRQSFDLWIQTISTDNWTLKEQMLTASNQTKTA